jgi:hypothetical protein
MCVRKERGGWWRNEGLKRGDVQRFLIFSQIGFVPCGGSTVRKKDKAGGGGVD